ncbi:putative calcium-binding protein CML25/26 [Triticum urartu]|uniref:Putative calcium-binding protein CML25/26 n=1 Tax=Triticum urartu TaxID=4572 RepID=M7Z1E7_TRIUA|nr:putative calcium-binding protein CML25/26 [Triticum urartu]
MAVLSVFAAFDKDGDGKVSVSELRRCMEATLGEDVPEEEAAEAAVILAAVDADGDGLLNQEEFSRLAAAGTHEEDNADIKLRCLREVFGMYASSSAEDMITPASLRRTLTRLGSHELRVEECRAMICRFDLDGDGKLSFDEFRVMMMV